MRREQFFSLLKRFDAYHEAALKQPTLTFPLRLVSSAAYRGIELALGSRHPHVQTVAQAEVLQVRASARSRTSSRTPTRSNVLFFSPRGWYAHTAFEAVFAKALELRGARPQFMLCDGGLRQCDFKPASDPHVTRPLCWRCQGFPRRLLEAFALPVRGYDALLDAAAHRRAREAVADLAIDELLALRYRDLPIGAFCEPSLLRTLLHREYRRVPGAVQVLRGLCESAILAADVAHAVVREGIDAVVLCNGLFHAERVFAEVATRAGVPVVSYERGWRPNSYHLVHAGYGSELALAARFPLDDAWSRVGPRPLDDVQRATIGRYLEERRRGRGGIEVYWPRIREERSLREKFGIAPGLRVAAAFPNIVWDTAVFGRDRTFDGLFDWLSHTIRVFGERPDWYLIIRVHPAEKRLVMQETRDRIIDRVAQAFPRLPANVSIIGPEDPLSSYVITDLADAVLVYTSTLGLEAAAAARPVVVAGEVHYARRGFTFEVERREDYVPTIERAFSVGALGQEQVELAHRYAYLLLYEYMKDFPFLDSSSRSSRGLCISELSELEPGRNRELDAMCAAVLEGAPLIT